MNIKLTYQTLFHCGINQSMPFVSMSLLFQKLNKSFVVPHIILWQFWWSLSICVSGLYRVVTQMDRLVTTSQSKWSWTKSQIGIPIKRKSKIIIWGYYSIRYWLSFYSFVILNSTHFYYSEEGKARREFKIKWILGYSLVLQNARNIKKTASI